MLFACIPWNVFREGSLPDSKVHEANMGPTWGRQDPGRPHVGPMNLAIWAGTGGAHWYKTPTNVVLPDVTATQMDYCLKMEQFKAIGHNAWC